MANFIDYLEWRGDLTWEQAPFNEVDNLILSYFSYVNLDEVIDSPDRFMTIREASGKFFRLYSEEDLKKDKSLIRDAPYGMKAMADTPRFGNLEIRNYVNQISHERAMQFSAMEIVLDQNTSYIDFRGTDDRITGWKEDFLLSNGTVEAEKASVRYLNRVAELSDRKLLIGGHSKGGNLAVYAAVCCNPEIRERIVTIFDNDGPGFTAEFLEKPEIEAVRERIVRIIPESSVVGLLLEHFTDPVIVKSSEKGVMQHDGLTWQVSRDRFARSRELSRMAVGLAQVLHDWMDTMDREQKNDFIEDVFAVLEAPGVKTLTELQNGGWKSIRAMLKRVEKLKPENRKVTEELLKDLAGHLADYILHPDKADEETKRWSEYGRDAKNP